MTKHPRREEFMQMAPVELLCQILKENQAVIDYQDEFNDYAKCHSDPESDEEGANHAADMADNHNNRLKILEDEAKDRGFNLSPLYRGYYATLRGEEI